MQLATVTNTVSQRGGTSKGVARSLPANTTPEPGRSFVLRYEGLPGGTPEANVTFK
jgi:hypothetical protein